MKKWLTLMKFGGFLGCHQMPERSFFVHGYQFPVCARCTGVLVAVLIAFPLFFIYKLNIWIAIILSFIMFLDWLIQYLKIKPSTNISRFITGLLGGFGWTYIHLYVYQFIINFVVTLIK